VNLLVVLERLVSYGTMILRLLPFGFIDSEYIWRRSRGFGVTHGAEYTLVFLAHVREPVLVRVRYGSVGWSAGNRLREFYVPRRLEKTLPTLGIGIPVPFLMRLLIAWFCRFARIVANMAAC